ncbi:MAG: DNA-binding response regulator [Clostridiales bacterium]|nr:DNA-binding response regulator [Clostridiales bacterium]
MNIIIVDDEPKIRKGLGRLLGLREGWVVAGVFEEAESALSFLYENEVDVVITDIQMPGMQGLDMVHKIREVNREIPVIIISGFSRFDYAQRAIELGVRKYITKPTSPEEITRTLEQIEQELSTRAEALRRTVAPPEGTAPVQNLLILRAIEYIEQNYPARLTLRDAANALYISPNYLSELFKKTTNQNFSDYLNDVRMERSRVYLADVSRKIGDVSEMVGFSDARYFSSAFRKKFGMTPLEYRNKFAAAGGKSQ